MKISDAGISLFTGEDRLQKFHVPKYAFSIYKQN